MQSKKHLIIFFAILLVGLSLDFSSKILAKEHLQFLQELAIIPNILNFKLTYNTGAAFSFLADFPIVIVILNSIIITGISVYSFLLIFSSNNIFRICSLGVLLSGALGNYLERLIFGKVTDFIDLLILPGDFAIFNVADILIDFAMLLILWELFIKKQS